MDIQKSHRGDIQECLREYLPVGHDDTDIWCEIFYFREKIFIISDFFWLEEEDVFLSSQLSYRRGYHLMTSSCGLIGIRDDTDDIEIILFEEILENI